MAHAGESPSGSGSSVGEIEFRSREDVEKLLNEKMKGEDKMGYKSQCETQMDYIKKLRSCIKWFGDLEDKHLMEEEKLRSMLESVERKYAEMEAEMEELNLVPEALNAALESALTGRFKEEENNFVPVKREWALFRWISYLMTTREFWRNLNEPNFKLSDEIRSLDEALDSLKLARYSVEKQVRDYLKLHLETESLRETISKLEEELNAPRARLVAALQLELHDARHKITLLTANLDHRMATAASQGERRAQIQEDTDMDG